MSSRCFREQLNSFETDLPAPQALVEGGDGETFRAVFIRAPAILDAGPSVEVLADITVPSGARVAGAPEDVDVRSELWSCSLSTEKREDDNANYVLIVSVYDL
jgi:5'-phosphate synthase pdxT subunit